MLPKEKVCCNNLLVPEMQNIKICQFVIGCLPTVCFAEASFYVSVGVKKINDTID